MEDIKKRLSDLERHRNEIADTLCGIQSELVQLRQRAEAGEVGDTTAVGKLMSDVRYWLKAARETEQEINQVKKQEAGIANDYAIDFERARTEVRCRLDRLRKCSEL